MKKSIIVLATTALLISCIIFLYDGWIYLMGSVMALTVMAVIRGSSTRVTRLTRWGKANPRKAQLVITLFQVAIGSLGIIAGYNFNKLGYELSNSTAIVFSSLIAMCFLFVPFLPKRNLIAIPKQVNKHRLAYTGIALSSFIIMIVFGNKIQGSYPNSFVANSLERIDQTVFPHDNEALLDNVSSNLMNREQDNVEANRPSDMVVFASFPVPNEKVLDKDAKKLEKKELKALKRLQKYRLLLAAGMTASAIILLILLIPVLCAGICLIIGGLSGEVAGGYVLLGALITGLTIWGMVRLTKAPKEKR